jgi:class 3 adenylate cyclase
MEPRIQYAQTSDGVSIAYCTLGEGMPLLHLPLTPVTHTQMSWQIPQYRRWLEGLARGRMLVLWDWRGCGLSGRGADDFSLDTLTLDLEAVASKVGADRFALFAMANAVPLALTHAAHHPERVTHLLLWHGYASYAGGEGAGAIAPHRDVATRSMDTWARMMAPLFVGEDASLELTQQMRRMLTEGTDADAFALMLEHTKDWDATAQLAHVRSPALILQRRRQEMPSMDIARSLATGIPKAELVVLDGDAWVPFAGDTDAALRAIDEFLVEGEEAEARAEHPGAGAFRTVLFTDVDGSTALTQRLGDAKARDLLRQHERMVREVLKSHGGSELKTLGDGFMASFSSATKALESAIAMQRAFAQHNESAEEPILIRVGLNAGEPIAEEEDLFGTAVIAAARIAAQARGGEILATDVVRQLVARKRFRFASRGRSALKGLAEAIEVYEVLWKE